MEGFLLGERERKKREGEPGDWSLGTGATEEKREAEREGERETENERDGRWTGLFQKGE